MGSPSEPTLAEIGTTAEELWKRVGTFFKITKGPATFKGRVTVFVFEKRYDYSEFGKMVEQRDLPFQQRAHWQYNRLDAYGAVMAGFEQPEQLEPFVAQQLAAIYVKSLGDVPGWFAEGSGRVFASSLAARDLDSRRRESEVTGRDVKDQLAAAMRRFVSNPEKCNIDVLRRVIRISKVFEWYGGDFADTNFVPNAASIPTFLADYVADDATSTALRSGSWKVTYFDYEWALNIQR